LPVTGFVAQAESATRRTNGAAALRDDT
jgi:hypothetical protein